MITAGYEILIHPVDWLDVLRELDNAFGLTTYTDTGMIDRFMGMVVFND